MFCSYVLTMSDYFTILLFPINLIVIKYYAILSDSSEMREGKFKLSNGALSHIWRILLLQECEKKLNIFNITLVRQQAEVEVRLSRIFHFSLNIIL